MPPDTRCVSDSDLESVLSYDLVKDTQIQSSKYKCSICGDLFKRMDQLDAHEYHHTGIKKHVCEYEGCDKAYSILTHLKRHLRTTHERVEPSQKSIKCSIDGCEKMFSLSSNMKRHVKEVHENPKVYYCSICNEKFTQKLKLKRHESNKHTGVYAYKCEKCGKGLHQQWQYERHVTVCKVYSCLHCEEKFDKWTVYRKHCREKEHTSKYYKCELCPGTFAKPSELQQHVSLKHMENTNDLECQLYKCPFEGCVKSYMYERNLTQHLKVSHDGMRFECNEANCGRSFSSAQNLNKHVKNGIHGADAKTKNKHKKKKKNNCRRNVEKSVTISNLATLSGITVNREFDKLLRERDKCALDVATENLLEETATKLLSESTEAT